MRILIDMDQVIAQWMERVLEWWNHDKGTNLSIEDISDWDMTASLGPHSIDFIRSSMRYPDFYQELDPVPGAVHGIRDLITAGHEVVIVSAVPASAAVSYHGKLAWLRKHMPFFNLKNFIAVQRKELIRGDILLDDGLHNIDAFQRTGRMAVVFDRPWNKDLPGKVYQSRVKDWPEFLALVRRLVLKDRATLASMQGPKAREAMTAAFAATPKEMGEAAVRQAQRKSICPGPEVSVPTLSPKRKSKMAKKITKTQRLLNEIDKRGSMSYTEILRFVTAMSPDYKIARQLYGKRSADIELPVSQFPGYWNAQLFGTSDREGLVNRFIRKDKRSGKYRLVNITGNTPAFYPRVNA